MPKTFPRRWPLATGLKWRLLRLASVAVLLAMMILGAARVSAQTIQVVHPTNSVWSYHTNKVDPAYTPADAWTALGFDDSSWPLGQGYFGLETTPAASYNPGAAVANPCNCFSGTYITPPGGQGGVSSYFRTHFNWTNVTQNVTFLFTNWVDDSIVVYLNGTVLFSFNVTDGKALPLAWNDAAPSGTANPLGEGVGIITNVVATSLQAGDNVLAVQLQQVGTGSSDDVFTMAGWALIPTPITITQQPTNATSVENRVLNLTVGVNGTAPQYQWFRGTNPAVTLTDATNATYTIANTQIADTDDYFVIVSNYLNVVTSRVARVTISNDTNGPVLVSAKADDTFQKITLQWDEIVSEGSAIEFGNYTITDPMNNAVTVNAISYTNGGTTVVLTVPTLSPDTVYTMEIDYQQDLVGNPTLPVGNPVNDPGGVVTSFHTWVISPGFARFQAYLGLPSGQNIAAFVAMPIYPDGSTFDFYTNVLYWPQSVPNIEQYAMRFTGLFVAPESGIHHFDPTHDDDMRLRVYANEDPNGAFTELAATGTSPLGSGPTLDVDLVAGNRYYYELIVREYGGGDYAGIGVTMPSGAVSAPIGSQLLVVAANPLGASVTITQQPADKVFIGVAGTSLLSQDFNASDGGFTVTTPQTYDGPWTYNSGTGSWRQNGQGPESNHPNTSLLDSPGLVLTAAGEVILSFNHRYSFEQDTVNWDGGQVRVSVNGGPFTAVPASSFSSNSYNGAVGSGSTSQLAGQPAFVGTSPGFTLITSVASLGEFNAGDVVRVEFMAASDGNTAGPQTPNWEIDAVQLIEGAVRNATFSVRATGTNDGGANPPQAYQWFRDDGAGFVAIPGATSRTYTFQPQPSDNGAQFRVIVYIPGASTTSTAATLTIGVAAPRLSMVRQPNGRLVLSWTGPSCLQETSTLNGPTIPWGASAVLNGVPFTPAPGPKFYRLTSNCPP